MSLPSITIDPLVCIGAGECLRAAPGVFEINDDDVAVVVDLGKADVETLREAERFCPSGAISLAFD